MKADFNPKSIHFDVDKLEEFNPTLKIKRGNKDALINVRLINKDQTLESNLSKGAVKDTTTLIVVFINF